MEGDASGDADVTPEMIARERSAYLWTARDLPERSFYGKGTVRGDGRCRGMERREKKDIGESARTDKERMICRVV